MKNENKKSVLETIYNLADVMIELNEVWSDNAEKIDLNELAANELYPFGEDFELVLCGVINWRDEIEEELSGQGLE
jgi:hypothetical protein